AVPIELQAGLIEDLVEELEIAAGEDDVGRLRQRGRRRRPRLPFGQLLLRSRLPALRRPFRAIEQTLKRLHGTRHALAETDAALAADIDLEDELAGRLVPHHGDITELKVLRF